MNEWDAHFINELAEAEFEALPIDIRAKLTRALDLLRAKGITVLVMPLARHVEGKVWELRATGRDGIGRSLYVAASGPASPDPAVIHQENTKNSAHGDRNSLEAA